MMKRRPGDQGVAGQVLEPENIMLDDLRHRGFYAPFSPLSLCPRAQQPYTGCFHLLKPFSKAAAPHHGQYLFNQMRHPRVLPSTETVHAEIETY